MNLEFCFYVAAFGAVIVLGESHVFDSNDHVESMSSSMADWFDVESCPPVEQLLNERQQSWFHSLGYSMEDTHARALAGWEPNCIRKEYRTLTDDERSRFHKAVIAMKNTMIDDWSEYDIMVTYHRFESSPAAHFGAAFYPWHREYLLRMERALQKHDPDVCLPYWDSTLDSFLPVVADSAMWTEDYMGNPNGTVDTGPFANWVAPEGCRSGWYELSRFVGLSETGKPFNDEDLEYIFAKDTYESLVCFVDCYFEAHHGRGHTLVGAHMGDIACSPTDPVFFLHHGFIDRVWEDFRQHSQTTDPELEYPIHSNDTDIGGDGHNPFSSMKPFDSLFNIHGMSNHYVNYYFNYAPRPISCDVDADCGSPILWCDAPEERCKAKVMEGGNCTGLPDHACACDMDGVPICLDEMCFC